MVSLNSETRQSDRALTAAASAVAGQWGFGVIEITGMPEKLLKKDALAPPMLKTLGNLRRAPPAVAAITI
jgi:hypothetical protein